MSEKSEKEDRGSVVEDLALSAVVCGPALAWGAVLGPVGFIAGAAAVAVALARGHDGSPKRPDPNDPA